ncbi:hypothetical protein GQ600_22637 [Phytophthora cactorum]|nr:hypothetical protein GQ600_22637 [Phytophthora cactorum]
MLDSLNFDNNLSDLFRWLVVEADIIDVWSKVFISLIGVVDKGDGGPDITGKVVDDLSYSDANSVNSHMDSDSISEASFELCSSVAREIICCQRATPATYVILMAVDIATAYRNVCTSSECVYMFAEQIPEVNVIAIDLSAAQPSGLYKYHWVDDHVNVTSDDGANYAEVDRSVRWAMAADMCPDAVNEDKSTPWIPRLRSLTRLLERLLYPCPRLQRPSDWDLRVHPNLAATNHVYTPTELELVAKFNKRVRHQLKRATSLTFAVQAWMPLWCEKHNQASPIHVHFRIDNATTASWQSKMAWPNSRAQLVVRFLGVWELQYRLDSSRPIFSVRRTPLLTLAHDAGDQCPTIICFRV